MMPSPCLAVLVVFVVAVPSATADERSGALPPPGVRSNPAWRTVTIAETLHAAEMTYNPQPYAGTLLLFSDPSLLAEDKCLGWKGLAEELKTFAIGDQATALRRDILNEPLVGLVAQQLTQCLEAADLRGSETLT